jgi:hypothetical protein
MLLSKIRNKLNEFYIREDVKLFDALDIELLDITRKIEKISSKRVVSKFLE